jgi:ABC-2 type transport system permease protein
MIAAMRAELVKVLRRRVLLIAAVTTVVFAVGSSAIVLAAAEPAGQPASGREPTVATLSDAGGGTEVFTTAISFAGTLLFVVFVGVVAVEFSRGTFRTMLLYQPRRLRLLAGKIAALIAFTAVLFAGVEALTWVTAKLLAPSQGVATGAWVSADALGQAVADYGSVLFWVTGYAVLGATVAVLVRSVPIALAIGIAWAGPFEHLLDDAWAPARRFFPGLLLEAFAAGGTQEVSSGRAALMVSVYAAIAAVVAGAAFASRDVTA